ADTPFGERARFFLLAIALCHTCVPEIDKETGEVFYQAASPDEFALVTAAKELGYVVVDKSMSSISLLINNESIIGLDTTNKGAATNVTYQILNVIEFSSKRKRMSVVYRLPDGRICLFCKGADSIVLERLRNPRKFRHKEKGLMGSDKEKLHLQESGYPIDIVDDQSGIFNQETSHDHSHERSYSVKSERSVIDLFPIRNEAWEYSETLFHIQEFATEGLRTLLYAHRFLDEAEYHEWNKLFQEASTAVVDRQRKLEHVAEMIERDLEITGATAIEDKLQDGVPEAIDKLRRAGIKVWMLTGDKRETAINIGYSCSLIKNFSETLIIDSTVPDLNSMLKRALKHVGNGKAKHIVAVVDGATLIVIERDAELMEKFVSLGILCDAVICCRVSPAQKALVVKSIRERLKATVTLAIGDGANDIAMIQEAHVGIGITGREGMQAARSSDYSIAQFRFLTSLLFVHGRWSYIRVSKFVLGTFYKCICFYLTQGIFQFFTGFSGTSLYEAWTLSLYNTLFSSLPVIVVGIFEKDLKRRTLIGVPELYQTGQRNEAFNLKLFLLWMGMGLYHAMVIVLVPAFLHGIFFSEELNDSGTPQLFDFGLVSYTSVVFIVTSKIAYLECHNWTLLTHVTSFLTLCGWFLWQTVYSFVYPVGGNALYDVRGSFQHQGKESIFWLSTLLTVSLAMIPNIILKAVKSVISPTDVDEYQEIEKDAERLQKIIEEGDANKEESDEEFDSEIGVGSRKDSGGKRSEKKKDKFDYSEQDVIMSNVNCGETVTLSTDDKPRYQLKDIQLPYHEENSSSASLMFHHG
ncbi:4348_t:CDS:1, partial [Acaulospora colombiana]